MVKYRKRVENWYSHVPKRTTPVGGTRRSENVFADALVLNSIKPFPGNNILPAKVFVCYDFQGASNFSKLLKIFSECHKNSIWMRRWTTQCLIQIQAVCIWHLGRDLSTVELRNLKLRYLKSCILHSDYLNKKCSLISFSNHDLVWVPFLQVQITRSEN